MGGNTLKEGRKEGRKRIGDGLVKRGKTRIAYV
jgi:hypothetical protein